MKFNEIMIYCSNYFVVLIKLKSFSRFQYKIKKDDYDSIYHTRDSVESYEFNRSRNVESKYLNRYLQCGEGGLVFAPLP